MAVAHSLVVSAYHVLDRGEPYHEFGADYLTRRHTSEARRTPVAYCPSSKGSGTR